MENCYTDTTCAFLGIWAEDCSGKPEVAAGAVAQAFPGVCFATASPTVFEKIVVDLKFLSAGGAPGKGSGHTMVQALWDKYPQSSLFVLTAIDKACSFYTRLGFVELKDEFGMSVKPDMADLPGDKTAREAAQKKAASPVRARLKQMLARELGPTLLPILEDEKQCNAVTDNIAEDVYDDEDLCYCTVRSATSAAQFRGAGGEASL